MVRKRSRKDRGASRGAVFVGLMAMLVGRIWGRLARRPVDSVAIIGAAAASLIIIINAVFLQSGSQRAPFVANPTASPQLAESRSDGPTPASTQGDALRAPVTQRSQRASDGSPRRSDRRPDRVVGRITASKPYGRVVVPLLSFLPVAA